MFIREILMSHHIVTITDNTILALSQKQRGQYKIDKAPINIKQSLMYTGTNLMKEGVSRRESRGVKSREEESI